MVEFSRSSLLLAKPILLKELFAKVDPALDELKSMTILCEFGTLRLYIVSCFCHILEETICKCFPFNSLSFKLGIGFAFVEKVSGVKKTPGDFES